MVWKRLLLAGAFILGLILLLSSSSAQAAGECEYFVTQVEDTVVTKITFEYTSCDLFNYPSVAGATFLGGWGNGFDPDAGETIAYWRPTYPHTYPGFYRDVVFDQPVSAVSFYYTTATHPPVLKAYDSSDNLIAEAIGRVNWRQWDFLGIDVREDTIVRVRIFGDTISGVFFLTLFDDLTFARKAPLLPDLSLAEINPTQVVEGPDVNNDEKTDLVLDKPTVVRVTVGIENAELLDPNQQVQVRLEFEEVAQQVETRTVNQLISGPMDFFLTPNVLGDRSIRVTIDSSGLILESNETNNAGSTTVTIKDTNGLYLAYFPVDRPITYFGYGPIDLAEYSETVNQSGKFIGAIYPVADGEFTNERRDEKYYGDPIPRLGMLDDAISLWLWGKLLTRTAADRAIGIVPDDYFSYHLFEDVRGVSFPGVHGVLVKEGDWVTAAHEIGHTYGLRLRWPFGPEEEYVTNPPGNPASGFWVNEQIKISNGICFMGEAGPERSFSYWDDRPFWVDKEDYTDLFKKFRTNKTDPDVLLISGHVSKDGTIQLGKLYLIEQGTGGYIIPGDYSIQIVDTDGQILTDIPFYTSFNMYVDPVGIVETDTAGFAFAIPYPENTAAIRIQYNGETLLETNPNSKLLHNAADSIPDYGFINNAEQRRSALHNKIRATEKMIEKNNFKGAINKLKLDIKDKFNKWLITDYQKENPEQLSKDEIIELVDEIIERLNSINS